MRVREIAGELFVDIDATDLEVLQSAMQRSSEYTFFSAGNGSEVPLRVRLVDRATISPLQRRIERFRREVELQEQWMKDCGGDLHGYIRSYGSYSDPNHFGDGGEAIYAADYSTLETLRRQLAHMTGEQP
jgi:hypothetical protein